MQEERSGEPKQTPRTPRAPGPIALLWVLALAVPVILLLTVQARPSDVEPQPAVLPPQTQRLAIVVVDGLRYDFAIDPALAPNFARNMNRHSSAVVWAGRVTMTSAAVLSLGTGMHGSFSNILLNVDTQRSAANDLFDNARREGHEAALFGDPVWKQAFGTFEYEHLSPADLALEIDDSREIFGAARRMIDGGNVPSIFIVHLFASDHQAHVHGIYSEKYRKFLRRFDQDLQALLDALPGDTTTFVLSDHGALANGNHGVDSIPERKTPMFAYGPGIAPGKKLELDQVELAPTFSALLGVSTPVHAVSVPAFDLLQLPPAAAGQLACSERDRIALLVKEAERDVLQKDLRATLPACDPGMPVSERISVARRAATSWDTHLARVAARTGQRGLIWSLLLMLALGAMLPLMRRTGTWRTSLFAAAALGAPPLATLLLTAFVDRSQPPWNDTRAAVAWVFSALLALVALSPRLSEKLYHHRPFLGLALVPGFLVVSFPTNTQLHAGMGVALALAGAGVALLRPHRSAVPVFALLGALLGAGLLLRFALVRDDPVGSLVHQDGLIWGLPILGGWLTLAFRFEPRRRPATELGISFLVVLAAALGRERVPALLGMALLFVLPASAMLVSRRGWVVLARALPAAFLALLARPVELPAIAAALLAAECIGMLLARAHVQYPESRAWLCVLATVACFGACFLLRVGLQRGLDFGQLDLAAGTFDSERVSAMRVAVALTLKTAVGMALPAIVLVRWLPADLRTATLELLTLGFILRLGTEAAILFSPSVSFWSNFRMVGDLGATAVAALLGAMAGLRWPRLGRVERAIAENR